MTDLDSSEKPDPDPFAEPYCSSTVIFTLNFSSTRLLRSKRESFKTSPITSSAEKSSFFQLFSVLPVMRNLNSVPPKSASSGNEGAYSVVSSAVVTSCSAEGRISPSASVPVPAAAPHPQSTEAARSAAKKAEACFINAFSMMCASKIKERTADADAPETN